MDADVVADVVERGSPLATQRFATEVEAPRAVFPVGMACADTWRSQNVGVRTNPA